MNNPRRTIKYGAVIIPLIYVTFVFAVIHCSIGFHYFVSDDYWMMRIFSGTFTGTPEMMPKNTSWLFSVIITTLYRIDNRFGWYTIMQVFLLWLSNCVICYCILSETKKLPEFGTVLGLFAFTLVYGAFEMLFAVNVIYSVTPAVCSGAACVLCLAQDREKGKRQNAFSSFISGILLFFTLIMREKTGYAAIAVYMGTLFIKVAAFKYDIKSAIKKAAVPLVIMAVILLTNALFIDSEWKSAIELEYARAQWIDYSHIPYEGNEQLYSSLGWTKADYDIAELYMMLDESFTTGNFNVLADEAAKLKPGLAQRLVAAAKSVWYYGGVFKYNEISVVLLCLTSAIFAVTGRKKRQIIAPLCYIIGFYALYIYIVSMGRVLRYVFSATVILASLPIAFCTIKIIVDNMDKNAGIIKKTARLGLVGITALALAALSYSEYFTTINLPKTPGWVMEEEYIDKINEYGIQNKENVYFFLPLGSAYGNTEKFFRKEIDYPANVITTISWCTQIPVYEKQLKLNGIEKLTKESFFKDNVYLIYGTAFPIKAEDYCLSPLMEYIKEDYPQAELEIVYEAPTFNVCKFIK